MNIKKSYVAAVMSAIMLISQPISVCAEEIIENTEYTGFYANEETVDEATFAVQEQLLSDEVMYGTEGNTVQTAVNVEFGRSYRKTWQNNTDHLNHYNKFFVPERGLIEIHATKPFDDDSEYAALEFSIYDEDSNLIWNTHNTNAISDIRTEYVAKIGLKAGTYFLTIKPRFRVVSGTLDTTYRIDYTKSDTYEIESNDAVATATEMKLNVRYEGYYGNDYGESGDKDCWKVYLTKGERYCLCIGEYSNVSNTTTILGLYDPSGADVIGIGYKYVHAISDIKKASNSEGENYVYFDAPMTGYHCIQFDNYCQRQYHYTIRVISENHQESSPEPDTPAPQPEENKQENPADENKVRAFVERIYSIMLGRAGDQGGIDDWTNQLVTKKNTGAGVAQGFVMSKELADQDISDEEFVLRLYRMFFNSDGDPNGRAYWLNELKKGRSRKYVFRGFAVSDQFTELCASYGIDRGGVPLSDKDKEYSDDNLHIDRQKVEEYVDRLFLTILGRAGDPTGRQYWIDRIMNREESAASVAMRGFFHSEEYKNANKSDIEFTKDCYRSMMGREADAGGLAYWETQLQTGAYTRDRMISHGFGNSEEFKQILRGYGLMRIE